jgi:hypothetical protein
MGRLGVRMALRWRSDLNSKCGVRTDLLSPSEFLQLELWVEVRLRLQLELQLLVQRHPFSFWPCCRLVWMLRDPRALRCALIFMFVVISEYAASGQEGRATSPIWVQKCNKGTWESMINGLASVNNPSHHRDTSIIIERGFKTHHSI